MDIPDIAIVVQWKATCKLTELWQRWGRAARAPGESGVAILFAEKDLFDDAREEKRNRQEAKKRRREETSSDLPPSKRTARDITSPDATDPGDQKTGANVSGPSPTPSDNRKLLRNAMLPSSFTASAEDGRVAKRGRRELDLAMDCLINADFRGVMCRRKVIEIYFEGEGAGEFPIAEA